MPCRGPPPPPKDQILWCGPPRGIKSYGVAPPRGSNPTLWPLPRDQILWYGPPRFIGDRTFRYGPSQGIGLSAVAPPGRSDFPLWPLPVDRTFCYSPPGGSDFPLWPLPGDQGPHRWVIRILFQSMQLPLKGQPVKNVSKPLTFMLVICSSLKKKVDPLRGATPWDRLRIRISRRIRIYIRKGFREGIRGLGDVFCF
jgi:hypothetical protein